MIIQMMLSSEKKQSFDNLQKILEKEGWEIVEGSFQLKMLVDKTQ